MWCPGATANVGASQEQDDKFFSGMYEEIESIDPDNDLLRLKRTSILTSPSLASTLPVRNNFLNLEKVCYLITHLVPLSGLLKFVVHGKTVEIAAFLWRTEYLMIFCSALMHKCYLRYFLNSSLRPENVTVNQQLCTDFFVDFYTI